jgi:hypothetical protein
MHVFAEIDAPRPKKREQFLDANDPAFSIPKATKIIYLKRVPLLGRYLALGTDRRTGNSLSEQPRSCAHALQPSDQWISLSGADPLSLVGVLTPGPRLAALTDNRLIYRDGIPIAALSAGKVEFLIAMDTKSQ